VDGHGGVEFDGDSLEGYSADSDFFVESGCFAVENFEGTSEFAELDVLFIN
jgi:hypothetical protein